MGFSSLQILDFVLLGIVTITAGWWKLRSQERLSSQARLERVVSERTHELEQRRGEVQALYDLSRTANSADNIDEALQRAVDVVCRTFGFPVGHAYAPSPDHPLLIESTPAWYAVDSGRYQAFRDATTDLGFSPSLGGVGHAFSSRQPEFFTQLSERDDFMRRDAAKAVGLDMGVFVPVFVRDEVVAVLEFFGTSYASLHWDDRRDFFLQIGRLLGRVIERRRTEYALSESEERFRGTFEQAAVGVAHVSVDGRLIRVNNRLSEITQFGESELRQLRFQDLILLDNERSAERERMHAMLRGDPSDHTSEVQCARADGSSVWVDLTVSLVHRPGGEPYYFVAVMQDIGKRKLFEQRLRALNAELEARVTERTAHLRAVNGELEAFSYSVSHDLRAPLRAIDGFSAALAEDYFGALDVTALDYLTRIRSEAQRMGQLIDDLLGLSRITRAEIRYSSVDITAMTNDIVSGLQRETLGRRVTVTVEPGIVACGDSGLIRVVMANLVGNAWKFTGRADDPRIEIGVTESGGQREYFVRDNGAGFDMEYAERLFGAFQRLHSEAEFPGHGIGLATVRRIVTRHGGSIRAESSVGGGATFRFTLGNRGCE